MGPSCRPPNDLRISCGLPSSRPHKPTLPQRRNRRTPPERSPASIRPVGCMRGLGGKPLWCLLTGSLPLPAGLDPVVPDHDGQLVRHGAAQAISGNCPLKSIAADGEPKSPVGHHEAVQDSLPECQLACLINPRAGPQPSGPPRWRQGGRIPDDQLDPCPRAGCATARFSPGHDPIALQVVQSWTDTLPRATGSQSAGEANGRQERPRMSHELPIGRGEGACEKICFLPPNDLRISCGPSCRRPHNPTFHSALTASCGRAEGGAQSGPSAACAG
jgi:hypothetical protein